MLPTFNCKSLGTLFGFDIRTWGIVQLIAVGIFIYLGYREARRLGISIRPWIWMIVIGTILSLIGMRLYHLFIVKYQGLWQGIVRLVTFKGGLDSAGSVLGIGAAILYIKKKKLDIGRYLDTLALPGAVLVTVARIGCYCAQCETGTVTKAAYGMFYKDALRNPIALYYIAAGLLLIGIILLVRQVRKWDGFLFTVFLYLYSVSRVFLDFYREIPPHIVFGLSTHQIAYLAISMICGSVIAYRFFVRKV
jgi:phosphatidylglycerol---prolipoprotein diacylglyceryl transferase